MRILITALVVLFAGCEKQPAAERDPVDVGSLIAVALVELSFDDSDHFVLHETTRCSWLEIALSGESHLDDPFAPPANPEESPDDRVCRRVADLLQGVSRGVDDKLIRKFIELNREEQDLREIEFPADLDIAWATSEELDQLAPADPRDAKAAWKRFEESYPDAYGFFIISRIAISDDRKVALLHYDHASGHLAGVSGFVVFRRVGSLWVSSSIPVGIS